MSTAAILVLRDSASRPRVELMAAEQGWREIGDVVRGHFVLAATRWYEADGTMIEYLEDHTADVRYMSIDGVGQEGIAVTIRDALACFSEDELLAALDETNDPIEWIRGLSRLCVLRPTAPDARYLRLWSRGLAHPMRAVRRAAIRTAYGCVWPELISAIRAREPEEDELQRPLRHLIAYLDRDDET